MIIDSESRAEFRRGLEKLVHEQSSQVMKGSYADLAAFERQRGIIVGLGLALDLLESKPTQTDTRSEDSNDPEHTD